MGAGWCEQRLHRLLDAVRDGALLRLRPISMTVAAIVAGLLPVMFGGGSGSEVMRRIAAPMIGGMLSALELPAVYLLCERRRRRSQVRRRTGLDVFRRRSRSVRGPITYSDNDVRSW